MLSSCSGKMLLFYLLLVPLILGQDVEYTFDTKYIEIPLDHFNFRDVTNFTLKYLVNETFFEPNGTIFFYTGNEGDIEMFAQNSGFMFDIAPDFNALIVFAEHRYYGESLPFGNLSYSSPEYLGYLSSPQALADFVYLINELQKIYATSDDVKKLPVIAFGGSYGGMLAAWLKMKYPNSVVGAVASSAPIWMFKGQNDCDAFYKIVTDDFQTLGSENCRDIINKSWEVVRSFTQNATGRTELANLWQLCQPFEADDVDTLTNWLSNVYVVLAETNYPYPTSFVVPLPANPVQQFCNIIDAYETEDDLSLLTALGEAVQIYANYTGTAECIQIDSNSESNSEQLGYYAWYFQECTEMIMPFCSGDSDMFESFDYDFEAFSDNCYETYKVRPRSEEVPLLIYGDKDLSTANNIIFSNGLRDPWSGYGVLTNVTPNIVALLISEGYHHSELRASNENDPPSVQDARIIESLHIKKWIDEYYNENQVGNQNNSGNSNYLIPVSNMQYVTTCFIILYYMYSLEN